MGMQWKVYGDFIKVAEPTFVVQLINVPLPQLCIIGDFFFYDH